MDAAQGLFLSKGYQETTIADIMEAVGGAKGMFYRCFESKEALISTLGDQLFFENNPFEAVRERDDLNGMEKIRTLLMLDQADTDRNEINLQAVSVLKDPRMLMATLEGNRKILTPLWRELLDEGVGDGSIQTEYPKELSELLPLVNFWMIPSLYPDTLQEQRHKLDFVKEMLEKMGLPLYDEAMTVRVEQQLEKLENQQQKLPKEEEVPI